MNKLLRNVVLHQHIIQHIIIHHYRIGLAGAGISLAFLHLVLTWQLMRQSDQVVMNALFWVAILSTIADDRHTAGRDRFSRFVGLLLLGAIVTKSLAIAHVEAWFVRLFPAFAVLSLGLLLSGFQLKRHWRAGLLLLPLMLPKGILERTIEQMIGQPLQVFTAQFAAFVLHYLGFNTAHHHTTITINQGAVEVLFRCTGIPLLMLLLQLALLFFVMVPLSQQQRVRIIFIAVLIAFLLSSLRVALMAIVVNDPIAFAYWHGGNGSQLFSTGAIVLFGWFCQQSLPRIGID